MLVAGGFAFGREAEIFDPATGRWIPAPPMSEMRQAPTATALKDGRVLLAGGFNSCCSIATAEIYDARTGAWSPAGAMSVPRGSFDAVLLDDGRVLVAGGLVADETVFDSTASAEVYDPRNNSWHRVADMSESRIDAGLTVLRNGHVLVSGGLQTPDFASIADAEIFDPRSEDWAPTAPLNLARGSHLSQSLFNGSVLMVDGDPNEEVPTATAEVFRRGHGHHD